TLASRSSAERGSARRGEPSSITGSRLSEGVFQSESSTMFLANDGIAGNASGVQNKMAALRRASRGKNPSAKAGRDGRTKTSTSATAATAYPAVPAEYSRNERSVSKKDGEERRQVTQVIGGKLLAISHHACGAAAARKTTVVTQGARERK